MAIARVCWIVHYGEIPNSAVVNANGDRRDNRLCNLRLATGSDVRARARLRRDNSSGLKGVHWAAARGRWVASIQRDGHKQYLGRFRTKEEAHAAYIKAARDLHGEFANTGTGQPPGE